MAEAGRGWPRLAEVGRGWPGLAAAGRGWPALGAAPGIPLHYRCTSALVKGLQPSQVGPRLLSSSGPAQACSRHPRPNLSGPCLPPRCSVVSSAAPATAARGRCPCGSVPTAVTCGGSGHASAPWCLRARRKARPRMPSAEGPVSQFKPPDLIYLNRMCSFFYQFFSSAAVTPRRVLFERAVSTNSIEAWLRWWRRPCGRRLPLRRPVRPCRRSCRRPIRRPCRHRRARYVCIPCRARPATRLQTTRVIWNPTSCATSSTSCMAATATAASV